MALSKELFRLATYHSWPLQTIISPLALAKCGFSYNGRGDEVECFLCKTRISGWNEGDSPQLKHRQMAPNCQLLNGNCTDNLPMEFSLSVPNEADVKAKSRTVTDCASNLNDKLQPHGETSVLSSILDQVLSRARKNGIHLNSNGPAIDGSQPDFGIYQSEAEHQFVSRPNCSSSANEVDRSGRSVLIPERAAPAREQLTLSTGDPPKHPAFKEYSARVESFRKGIVGEGQTAEGLADAGWFHVGPNDKVRCFQCGGNLRDWEQGDDPWEEHKRWYDYCPYTKTHRPQSRPRAPEIPAILTIPSTIGSYRIEPREVKARMDTPTVRAILDMGYSRDKVKAVIEIRLSTTGDDFPNAESLLEALFRLEEPTTSSTSTGGATASSFASEDGNHSVYNNISTAASTTSGSSGYSTASSSASAVLLQQDLTSLPPTNSAKDSATSVQSKTAASKDKASVSLKSESAAVTTAPDASQSRTKAKKKKTKKKKTSSAAAATSSTANGDEDAAAEETAEAQNDPEKMNVDEEEVNMEGNFDEIPDEEASKWLEENRQLREQRTCKVCMDAEVNTVFLPCGHLVCCATCSPHLRNCPICRTFIRGTVKTFLS